MLCVICIQLSVFDMGIYLYHCMVLPQLTCVMYRCSLLLAVIGSNNWLECCLVSDWLPGNRDVGMAARMNAKLCCRV